MSTTTSLYGTASIRLGSYEYHYKFAWHCKDEYHYKFAWHCKYKYHGACLH